MIKADIRDYAKYWSQNISRIKPTSQTCFNDSNINLLSGKIFKGHGNRNLKIGRLYGSELIFIGLYKINDKGFGHPLPIYFNPLPEVIIMRRSVQSGFKTIGLQDGT